MVNSMAQSVGNLLQGKHGWMGILGSMLTNLPGPGHGAGRERAAIEDERADDEDDGRRRRHRHRRYDDY